MTADTIQCGLHGCTDETAPALSEWFLHLQLVHHLTLMECLEVMRDYAIIAKELQELSV